MGEEQKLSCIITLKGYYLKSGTSNKALVMHEGLQYADEKNKLIWSEPNFPNSDKLNSKLSKEFYGIENYGCSDVLFSSPSLSILKFCLFTSVLT